MLKHSPLARRIASGGMTVTAGRLFGLLCNFLQAAILARLLAPDDMGAYFLALNLATFFGILARLGAENVALKLFSDRLNGENHTALCKLATQFAVLIGAASGVLAILMLASRELLLLRLAGSPALLAAAGWLALWSVAIGMQAVLAEIFRAFRAFLLASLFQGALPAALTVAVLAAGWWAGKAMGLRDVLTVVVLVLMLANLAGAIRAWQLCRRFDAAQPITTGQTSYGAILALAWPLCISQMAMSVASLSDLWLIQAYGHGAQVAYYGAASRLVLFVALALHIANAVLPPFISQLRLEGDLVRFERMMRFVATMASLPAAVITLACWFFGAPILQAVYGAGYEAGSSVLAWLALGQLANALAGSCGYVIIMHGRGRWLMSVSLFSGALAIAASLLVLQRGGGMTEVAICYATAMSVQQLLMLLLAKRVSGVYTHFGIFKP